jgi:hypothetical protein
MLPCPWSPILFDVLLAVTKPGEPETDLVRSPVESSLARAAISIACLIILVLVLVLRLHFRPLHLLASSLLAHAPPEAMKSLDI